ncbi:MAG: OmpA family protein [Acidobacteriota bacterium]
MKQTSITAALALGLAFGGVVSAQTPAERNENAQRAAAGLSPIYRVSVTERTAKAINYRSRNGATKIDFRGTSLMPKSHGEAKVESKQGYIEVEVEFDELVPANKFGAEYLTYVLWAITPEGRTANLGEILLNGTESKLNVTTELQVFGLVVTAEPYFSVTRPSDLIVMENVVRKDTVGIVQEVDAKYELFERGQYEKRTNALMLKMDKNTPLELYEARNAVNIARSMGADVFAAETFVKAEKSLAQAEAYHTRKAGTKPITMISREAVQTAEDSRAIAVKRQEENALTAERNLAANRQEVAENGRAAAQSEADRATRNAANARIAADAEAERVRRNTNAQTAAAQAEADRLKQANDARLSASLTEANRLKQENDMRAAAAQADANRLKQENDQRAATAQADADRLKRENDQRTAAAQVEADRLKRQNDDRAIAANLEANRLKMENDAQRAAAQLALDRAAGDKARLERERTELRTLLLQQFNTVLQTRDTARGLIVNMSDVIFDTGKFTLLPGAREKLAKVAGIVSGHPGLSLSVEGHTDSVGTDESNQVLSEHRGGAVRDYLLGQGMAVGSVTSKGFGESQPVASNDNSAGRQQNRRVEIVISGDIIGGQVGAPIAAR